MTRLTIEPAGHKPLANGAHYTTYKFTSVDPLLKEALGHLKPFTVGELAAKSGVSPSALDKWRTGRTASPRLATLRAVLRAFGYDLAIISRN